MMYRRCLAMMLIGLALAGCGGVKQLPIAGQVTVGGEPVDRGLVTFQPTDPAQAVGGAKIEDGKFSFEKGQGLPAGTYDVSVTAMKLTGRMIEDRQSPNPVEELEAMNVGTESLPVVISEKNSENLEVAFPAAE